MSGAGQVNPRRLSVHVAQLNATVGDIDGNTSQVVSALERARDNGADLAVFPEMVITGYPPEDLLLRPTFVAEAADAVRSLAPHTIGFTAVVGFPDRGADLHNAAAIIHDGLLAHVVHKAVLPNYGVFDEERYFRAGDEVTLIERSGARFGVSICEDIWLSSGPPRMQATAGAELLVNISASPYVRAKGDQRRRMLATRAADNLAFVVYCNLVGGQDELVFDGQSLVFGPTGSLLACGAAFSEDHFMVELNLEQVFHERLMDPRERGRRPFIAQPVVVRRLTLAPLADRRGQVPRAAARAGEFSPIPLRGSRDPGTMGGASDELSIGPEPLDGYAEVWAALRLGTSDYVSKNGFSDVVIGLSGGIDSALTATLAADALGPEHVIGVGMPARYSAPMSLDDARELAAVRDMRFLEVPIDASFQAMLDTLAPTFETVAPDVTEENLQSRIRGMILMALSNKFGWLVLTTGNKSEVSVGYSTLYGDTAGGFAPLKDVPKTLVYELSRWRNGLPDGPVIPRRSIERAPSAELRHDQTDQDTLPPYELLDPILTAYVEEEMGVGEIVAQGYERELVERVARLVDRAEYKRRQGPPGIKISGRAFGRDRRMPITKR